jgi:hypothetical protein
VATYIANFGRGNYLWPECLDKSTIATFEDEDVRDFWLAGDRESYIRYAVANKRTARGITPTRSVASRWFNIETIISTTSGDTWIHREKDQIWWTVSLSEPASVELRPAMFPVKPGDRAFVVQKPANGWSNRNKKRVKLDWTSLHPKAKEFLFTEGTLQALSPDNAEYAAALINGDELTHWHQRADWMKKVARAGKSPVTVLSPKQSAAARMAMMADDVASRSGSVVSSISKLKNFNFQSRSELEAYIEKLIDAQDGVCALSNIPLQFDGDYEDEQLLASLDRIDSDRDYEEGNLQVVCRFINRWKSDDTDEQFLKLLAYVRASQAL